MKLHQPGKPFEEERAIPNPAHQPVREPRHAPPSKTPVAPPPPVKIPEKV